MKEFFKKPLVHYTTVLTIVAIVCGLLIGGVNAITAPVIKQNMIDAQNKAYQEVLPAGKTFEEINLVDAPSSITTAVKGLDASNQVVGYIYIAAGTNKHGSMRIAISIDAKGKILGAQFVDIQQTLNVEGTRSNLALFIGTQISSLTPDGDLVSGVTNSYNTVKALLTDVATVHAKVADVPADPYTTMFGEGFTKELDSSFISTTYVKSKEVVKDSNGVQIAYLYKLNGFGKYDSDSAEEKDITLYVGVDNDGKILGIVVPANEYNHTGGGLYTNTVTFLEVYTNTMLSNVETTGTDLTSGATNSKILANKLMAALKEVVLG
jgi:Na+-translocating ferredoxin:NAD+ oxidoreductase RnfG subunit